MFIACAPIGGLAPLARRLRCLLLAGVALALPHFAYAQDADLRGSISDDIAAAATTDADDAGADADGFYSPEQDNAPSGKGDLSQETPAADPVSEDSTFLPDNIRVGAVLPDDNTVRAQRENLRAWPEQGRSFTPEADPYAPIGIRAGSFILKPSLEQGIKATSNGDNSSNGSRAILNETTLRLNALSDWLQHQASLDASGTFSKSISGQDVSEPQANILGRLRLDLANQTTVNAETSYRLRRESASSPNGVVDALKRPLVHTFAGRLGVERDMGLLFGRVTGGLEHDMYGNAELASGGTVTQKDRNNTYASVAIRGGFSLSPALKPFAEVELGKRMFDERIDSNGYERSGRQYALRGGLVFDRGEKFNGEIAAGYMQADSDDPRLANISGPSINAMVNWSPLRGTDMRFFAQTMVDTSTTPGVAGSLQHFASLDITRRVRANLSFNGKLDANIRQNKDGTGTDYTLGAEIGATYWLNRMVAIDARLRHEFQTSQVADREYQSNSIYVGMKFQK